MTNDAELFDLGTEGEAQASPDALKNVRATIKEAGETVEMIEQLEDDLKAAKAHLQHLRTSRLPDLMAEIQSDHFTHAGYDIKVSDFVSGSLPKGDEEREAAMDWLKAHDGEGLIKTDIKMAFGMSQHNEALDLAAQLTEDGHSLTLSEGVHAASLQRYARERIAAGDEIDPDKLGLYIGKFAKVTRVKS